MVGLKPVTQNFFLFYKVLCLRRSIIHLCYNVEVHLYLRYRHCWFIISCSCKYHWLIFIRTILKVSLTNIFAQYHPLIDCCSWYRLKRRSSLKNVSRLARTCNDKQSYKKKRLDLLKNNANMKMLFSHALLEHFCARLLRHPKATNYVSHFWLLSRCLWSHSYRFSKSSCKYVCTCLSRNRTRPRGACAKKGIEMSSTVETSSFP